MLRSMKLVLSCIICLVLCLSMHTAIKGTLSLAPTEEILVNDVDAKTTVKKIKIKSSTVVKKLNKIVKTKSWNKKKYDKMCLKFVADFWASQGGDTGQCRHRHGLCAEACRLSFDEEYSDRS